MAWMWLKRTIDYVNFLVVWPVQTNLIHADVKKIEKIDVTNHLHVWRCWPCQTFRFKEWPKLCKWTAPFPPESWSVNYTWPFPPEIWSVNDNLQVVHTCAVTKFFQKLVDHFMLSDKSFSENIPQNGRKVSSDQLSLELDRTYVTQTSCNELQQLTPREVNNWKFL